MTKELVEIEFRYTDKPLNSDSSDYVSKTITIGVYDSFDEACIHGNKLMENLESKFKLHMFPNGNFAQKERFSKNGGCFGYPNRLISNLAYLKTPFQFYARIVKLDYLDIDKTILEILEANKRYKDFKNSIED